MAGSRKELRGLLGALTGTPEPATKARMAAHQRLRDHHSDWLADSGVQGFGLGRKIVNGRRTGRLALRVYVDRKLPLEELDNSAVPKTIQASWLSQPAVTDVIPIGRMVLESNTAKVRPPAPGFGIGSGGRFGTLGCIVRREGDAGVYLFTAGHVIGVGGDASLGRPIIQPTLRDGGSANDRIASTSGVCLLSFTETGYPNLVDAAIGQFDMPHDVDPFIRMIGTPKGVSSGITEGMRVQKTGYTTDYTTSHVRDPHFVMAVAYPLPNGGSARAGFRDLVLCDRYGAEGDSGSAILNDRRELIGVHLSGSASSSAFCRISHAFNHLGLKPY